MMLQKFMIETFVVVTLAIRVFKLGMKIILTDP